jgi:hypothetical protein
MTAQELLDEQVAIQEDCERIQFVREAAIRIYASHQGMDSRDAWRAAKWLWEVKPEDC